MTDEIVVTNEEYDTFADLHVPYKKSCPPDSVDGAEQQVSPIIHHTEIMANIVSYLDCPKSVAKITLALNRFAKQILALVTQLDLLSLHDCHCKILDNGLLKHFARLQHLHFACVRAEWRSDKQNTCELDNVALSQSLETIHLKTSSSTLVGSLLGKTIRNHLTVLKLEGADYHIQSFKPFELPNLEIFTIDSLNIVSISTTPNLDSWLNELNANSPLLRHLSVVVVYEEPYYNAIQATVDMNGFKHLESFSIAFSANSQKHWSFDIDLPQSLRTLSMACIMLNRVNFAVAVPKLAVIYITEPIGRGVLTVPLCELAPNLEKLYCNVRIVLSGTNQPASMFNLLPKLDLISGSLIADNVDDWQCAMNAIASGKKLTITSPENMVMVDGSNANFVPPFGKIALLEENLLSKLPDITLASLHSLELPNPGLQELCQFQRLSTHLISLYIHGVNVLAIDWDLTSFDALRTLKLLFVNVETLEALGRLKQLVMEALPSYLKKLMLFHNTATMTSLLERAVTDIRASSVSFPLLVKKYPMLEQFGSQFPVVDFDEGEAMEKLDITRFRRISIMTCRGGVCCFNAQHYANLSRWFLSPYLDITVKVTQWAWKVYYTNPSRSVSCLDNLPECLNQTSDLWQIRREILLDEKGVIQCQKLQLKSMLDQKK